MTHVVAERTLLRVVLGCELESRYSVGSIVLAGDTSEEIFGVTMPGKRQSNFHIFEAEEWLLGFASVTPSDDLAGVTGHLYHEMLSLTHGRHLARIWNYVPAINELGASGLENYREFCRGRSMAFERFHGVGFKAALPAASAVGNEGDRLSVVFAAHPATPRHFENPLQLPAYDYPVDYGPRAPSFARASTVENVPKPVVFISGTAAIRGHRSIAPGDTVGQIDCALENLHVISHAAGLGVDLSAKAGWRRNFKVYIRHEADLKEVMAILNRRLFRDGDRVSYVKADICRAELNFEIEATLCG